MNKIIACVLLFLFANSCAPYDCTRIDTTRCGTPSEQIERLIGTLLDHPDDLICILENEQCIDCSKTLLFLKPKTVEKIKISALKSFAKVSNYSEDIYIDSVLIHTSLLDDIINEYKKTLTCSLTETICWTSPLDDGGFSQLVFRFYLDQDGSLEMFRVF